MFVVVLVSLPCLAIFDFQTYDLGNWRCAFTNYGTWGYGVGRAGAYWHDSAYVFGAGIWIGRRIGNDTLVTVGYNTSSGRSEMFPL